MIKKTLSMTGKIAGAVMGEPVKFVGKKVKSEFVQNVGSGIKHVTANTGEVLGGLGQGTWDTAAGLVRKDKDQHRTGLNELGKTATHTAKGMGRSLKYTYGNGKDIVLGAVHKDKDRMVHGAKRLGETVAIGTLSIGVLDVVGVIDVDGHDGTNIAHADTGLDGAVVAHTNTAHVGMDGSHQILTRNDDLADHVHPVTGVPFHEEHLIMPNGLPIDGTFPDFHSDYDVQLPQNMYLGSDEVHFHYADVQLAKAVHQSPDIAAEFDPHQLAQIDAVETPDGYTWHHSEVPGKLELVDEKIHSETGHTGGCELWGGGTENR